MWRQIAEVGLTLGGFFLVGAFGLPIALLGAALIFWDKEEMRNWSYGFIILAAFAAGALIPAYLESVDRCQELERARALEDSLDSYSGNQMASKNDLEYQSDCQDLPFAGQ